MKWSVLINPFVGCVTHSPLSEHRRGIECVCALYSDLWAAPNVQSQHVILPDGSVNFHDKFNSGMAYVR
ncbi:hypothetical protein Y032_0012g1817 [Ancylostoma ceylanicum]|uniref:Uncharacterized protein n=1 Tax=Ancylostoma ceylanicum TaxID=53326 RepID=A0A016VCZ8_9BILA|nr:hypothetical protein Y032_0012g1817 [Ancylostoma ceylanicum]